MKRIAALCLAAVAASIGGTASAQPAPASPQVSPGADVYSGYAAVGPSFTVMTGHWKQTAVTCPVADELGLAGGAVNTLMTGSSIQKIPGLADIPGAVEGTLYVPHVATWIGMVGMHGPKDRQLIQTGTTAICQDGEPHYGAFFETPSFDNQADEPTVDAGAPGLRWETPPAAVGDDIAATITWDGAATYRLTLADTTRNWHYGATYRSEVTPTAALSVVEAIPYNVPGFAPVTFTDVTANGKPLDAYHPQTMSITWPRVTPTPIRGGSFTVPSP